MSEVCPPAAPAPERRDHIAIFLLSFTVLVP
jgi:hypothetical protein